MRRSGEAVQSGAARLGSGIASGASRVSRPVAFGARKLAGGASKLWIWDKKEAEDAQAAGASAQVATPPAGEEKALPPAHPFPKTGLLVTDAELGPDATRLQSTSVTLGGWEIRGDDIAYRLEPGFTDPVALRVRGAPAAGTQSTAGGSATTAEAREFHYHSASGVLVLRGDPTLSTQGSRVTVSGPDALIKIHLPSGAMSFEGAVRWTSG